MVMTVLGEVDPSTLGLTYVHEHVLACSPGTHDSFPQLWDREEVRLKAIEIAKTAKAHGVDSIVDMTPADFHRDPLMVRDVAEASGINIVHATGAYWHTTMFGMARDIETLVEVFTHDIKVGMNGTNVRAGILKAGTGTEGGTPANRKLLTAVARTQVATGVPIATHADMGAHAGLAQLEVFQAEGVDLSKVVIGHSGDTDDYEYLEKVLATGVTIGLDRFGLERLWPDEKRIDLCEELIKRGYADQMVVAHDACCHSDFIAPQFLAEQPRWNWLDIVDNVLPELRKRGVSESDIKKITVDNPARVLG